MNQIDPNIDVPISSGLIGTVNYLVQERNIRFAGWLTALLIELKQAKHIAEVDYVKGVNNWAFTQPDSAWLKIDGYWIYASLEMYQRFNSNAMPWIETSLSNQKAFGRVERES